MRVQPKAVGMLSIYTAIHQSVEPNRMLCIRFWNAREREGGREVGREGERGERAPDLLHILLGVIVLYLNRIFSSR